MAEQYPFLSSDWIQEAVGFTTAGPGGEPIAAFVLAFPWRITVGTFVTMLVALCFRTPADRVRTSADADLQHDRDDAARGE